MIYQRDDRSIFNLDLQKILFVIHDGKDDKSVSVYAHGVIHQESPKTEHNIERLFTGTEEQCLDFMAGIAIVWDAHTPESLMTMGRIRRNTTVDIGD